MAKKITETASDLVARLAAKRAEIRDAEEEVRELDSLSAR